MDRKFVTPTIGRRIVALIAAYAIALSSLIASLSAVRAAAADVTSSGITICQPTLFGQTAPTGVPPDCDSCCIGCPILLAAVPPAPTIAIVIQQTPGMLLPLPAKTELPSDPQTRSHRSRAPPQTA